MLENIIKNPIETPRGYKNPDYGIALRGPLSQFFSALYLKFLDDSFDTMDVTYIRYNVSFRMHERYVMHANKLSKWLPVESLSNESSATCFVGVRGGCKRQTVGQSMNY